MDLPLRIDAGKISRIAWGVVLLCLPVTSFRYFPFLGKETMVQPLAFYPLAVLAVVLAWRLIKHDIRFKPNGSLALLGLFLVVALAATAWGWAYGPIPMHGQEFIGRALRAWVTLAGGMMLFACAMLMNQDEDDLRFTLKWLYVGLALSILWGAVQMVSYLTGFPERADLNEIQQSFSIRKLLVKKRAAGFAYEPSWLANQIATIYLPWLLAALLSGYRIFKRRWMEFLLLAGTSGLLICTFSRGGILMSVMAVVIVFLLTQWGRIRTWGGWYVRPFKHSQAANRMGGIAIRAGILLAVTAVLAGALLLLSTNKYFAKIWQSQKDSLVEYAVDIYAGPRLAYATAGWEVFQEQPLTGVGLGATGLTLYDHIPDWAVTTVSEISRQLTPNGWLYPNPKNLYIRLLAETGIAGFLIYLIYWLSILGSVIQLLTREEALAKFVGVAGLYLWFVLIFFNFTQDSLIDPNQWLGLGMLLGMSAVVLTKKKEPAGSSSSRLIACYY